ncbi:MAG: MarR family transcriptional regulator [Rhodobiaceae bacterium]|nr:MarR family transcriptional regulator [Rhodobiaceae bacterium]
MTGHEETDPARQAFGRLATMAASRAQGAAQRYLNRFGIKLAYWPILLSLSQGGEKTQVELAAQVDRTTAAVSLILGEMEREGLVTRRTNPDSRREVLVALTRLGQEKWAESATMWRQVNAIAHAGMSGNEIALLDDLLTRAIANLERG